MKLYNARVRLNGSVMSEVNKKVLTAPEVLILKRIHGDDGVLNITEVGHVKRTHSKERARLAGIYRVGPDANRKERLEGASFIDSIFGAAGVPLPEEYTIEAKEAETDVEAKEETEEIVIYDSPKTEGEDEVIVRTHVPKKESVEDLTA